MAAKTVREFKADLSAMPDWLEVTVTDGDVHYDVTEVRLTADNEGEKVVAIQYEP